MLRSFACIVVLCLTVPAFAETNRDKVLEDDEAAAETLSSDDKAEILEFTQKERQGAFDSGLAASIGPAMPWSRYGLAFVSKQGERMNTWSLGVGSFDFNDNYRERNYVVSLRSQSVFYTYRSFPLGFGPLYFEPMVGLVSWTGDIQPRGADAILDEIAASLSSRFSATGAAFGGNLGLMWFFSPRFFVEYNLFSLHGAYLFSERYSTSTSNARNQIRKQLRGPLAMNSVHLRFGWSWSL